MKIWQIYCVAGLFIGGVATIYLPPIPIPNLLKTFVLETPDPSKYHPRYAARMAANQGHADVIMLGDSITENGNWDELVPKSSILNCGISGDTSKGVIARLDDVIARKPRVVFLMIGVNDLFSGTQPRTVEQNVRTIVWKLAANRIPTIVQSTLFVSHNHQINTKIRVLNVALREWCLRADVPYIDLNREFAPAGSLLPRYAADAVHLNAEGYLRWRDAIAAKIAALTKKR